MKTTNEHDYTNIDCSLCKDTYHIQTLHGHVPCPACCPPEYDDCIDDGASDVDCDNAGDEYGFENE